MKRASLAIITRKMQLQASVTHYFTSTRQAKTLGWTTPRFAQAVEHPAVVGVTCYKDFGKQSLDYTCISYNPALPLTESSLELLELLGMRT